MALDFLSLASSDNIIAIVIFLIFMIILFVIFLRITTALLSYLFSLNGHAKLLNGMVSSSSELKIVQDPSLPNSILVSRSENKTGGIEFTWSVWCFIEQITPTTPPLYNNIFVKGTNVFDPNTGVSSVNCPGLYISKTGELLVVVNTFAEVNKQIVIPNIPISNWLQIILTCENNTINIYINGILIKSVILTSVVNHNYGDVIIGSNGGFNGFISNLWYWNKTLSILEIQNLYARGPSTRSADANMNDYRNVPKSNYLALSYYMQ